MVDHRLNGLLTDFYQLTMLESYLLRDMLAPAVFELFVRTLPPGRNFLVAAGLEQTLEFLEGLAFAEAELSALEPRLGRRLVEYLRALRFSGDIDALPEGTIFFANEPLLRVTAPLPEGQLVETRLMNLVHLQTTIASKAVRLVLAARGRLLVDFGLRRAHGAEAGILGSRAAYLSGFSGTSNVVAGLSFGIPLQGTMAHAYVQAFPDERAAFEAFASDAGADAVLLLDTYDTITAAERVASLGLPVRGVRLDSGDLLAEARRVRDILDGAGLRQVRIFASGGLDEQAIAELVDRGAPIDGFGVGTRLATSADAPFLDCAYKLQEYAGRPCRKRSTGKATWPGRKQVFRSYDRDGAMARDVVALVGEAQPGEPLLVPVMRGGRRLPQPSLEQARARLRDQLARLPARLRALDRADPPHPVAIAASVRALAEQLDRQG